MSGFKGLPSTILIFAVTILYAFAYIEILFVVRRIFCREKFKPPLEFICAYMCIPLLLFVGSYFTRTSLAEISTPYNLRPDLFFLSLALFLSSVALYALGLIIKETWDQKIREMNIKLLSTYSLWVIWGIYLAAVFVCFLLALLFLIFSSGLDVLHFIH